MKKILIIYNRFTNDSLFSNSVYLILSTVIAAVLGYFFWIINARIFSPAEVGIGTTLISAMNLLSGFCILGLGASIVKYLPSSKKKSEIINTAFTLITAASILASLIYIGFIDIFSPKLIFIKENILYLMLFILFVIASSLNTISQHIFVAYRASIYVFIKNTLLSILKLIFPFILMFMGAYGVFTSVGIPTVIAFIASAIFLYAKFEHTTAPKLNKDIVKTMAQFSTANYIMGLVSTIPSLILPILINNYMASEYSAYFYMDMMIASFLYMIPQATSQSLFAEGSYNKEVLADLLKKAIKIITGLLVPSMIAVMLFGRLILLTFGKDYSNEGIVLLQLLSASSIFIAINSLGNSVLYIKHKIRAALIVNFVSTVAIIYLSILLVDWGLYGIGLAWLIGNAVISLYFLPLFINKKSI